MTKKPSKALAATKNESPPRRAMGCGYGTAEVTNGDGTFLLSENDSTYMPIGQTHGLSNPRKQDLVLIEVQSGSCLGEADIV